MKKIMLVGVLLGLLLPSVVKAEEETVAKYTDDSSLMKDSETSSPIQPMESQESTNQFIVKEETTYNQNPEDTLAKKEAVSDEKSEPTLVDLTKMFVTFKEGSPITEAEFYQVAKEAPVMKQDGVKSFTFIEGQTVSTTHIGEFMDSVKLYGTTNSGEVRIYAMSYIVINNAATLTLSNIRYDENTGILSGKTIAGAQLTITDDLTKEKNKIDAIADSSGRFEMKGTYEPGSTWYIQAFDAKDPLGNYSEIVTFIVPKKQVVTNPSTSEEKRTVNSTNSPKAKDRKSLPQTGEIANFSMILIGGVFIGLVVFGYAKLKLVKNN